MTDNETVKDLKTRLRNTRHTLKFVVSGIIVVYTALLIAAWWYVRILAVLGGNLASQQFGETGGALIASGYYASDLLISVSLMLAVCLLFTVIWCEEINKLVAKFDTMKITFTPKEPKSEQKPESKEE